MTKISELPIATTPLTGSETLPLVNGSVGSRTSVGQSQILAGIDASQSAAGIPPGTMSFGVGLVGGNVPVWSDGSQWRGPSGDAVNNMGLGIWIVGSGLSATGTPATQVGMRTGYYWISEDGFIWGLARFTSIARGIERISYANGCWLLSGQQNELESSVIATNLDPYAPALWSTVAPFGAFPGAGTTPLAPSAYNNDTGFFTVPVTGGGTEQILNPLPSAVIPPDSPPWPWVGQNGSLGVDGGPAPPVSGLGTAGPVEVRINSKQIKIPQRTFDFGVQEFTPGIYTSHYLEARKLGTFDYLPVRVASVGVTVEQTRQLAGLSIESAGLVLRGLVWGPLKQTAVRFPPGGT